jgi:hypothetical protein
MAPAQPTEPSVPAADRVDMRPVPTARPVNTRADHPLGPLCRMVPLESRLGGRLYSAGVLGVVVAIFVAAGRLHPDGLDHGAHQQFGLPPCGFLVMTGLPCPTCGMTTAFAYTIHGRPIAAIHAQPAGFLLAAALSAVGVLAAVAIATGRRPAFNWYRIDPVRLVWIGCGLFVAGWAIKIVLCLLGGSAGT